MVVGDNLRRMTARDFRRIVLGLEGAVEGAHMGHPDFRVHDRIFATLRNRDTLGMVVLPPGEQRRMLGAHPDVFAPESGAWGRAGCTRFQLEAIDEETLGEAATLAWRNTATKATTATKTAAPRRPRRSRGSTAASKRHA
jgi:hypothetical protein